MRSICNTCITFGLVNIPVKVYLAAKSEPISLNYITPQNNKVKMQYIDPETGEEVKVGECYKGYEYNKGAVVKFSKEELKELEPSGSNGIDILEFIPVSEINPVLIEKSYYLNPDNGGDKGYGLLQFILNEQNKVALVKWFTRGREYLAIIQPYKDGLLLQQIYYHDEVRGFEFDYTPVEISSEEKRLARKLVKEKSVKELQHDKYEDSYKRNLLNAVEKKIQENSGVTPKAPNKNMELDLTQTLKNSVSKKTRKKRTA